MYHCDELEDSDPGFELSVWEVANKHFTETAYIALSIVT